MPDPLTFVTDGTLVFGGSLHVTCYSTGGDGTKTAMAPSEISWDGFGDAFTFAPDETGFAVTANASLTSLPASVGATAHGPNGTLGTIHILVNPAPILFTIP